jgi:hypothetical protein
MEPKFTLVDSAHLFWADMVKLRRQQKAQAAKAQQLPPNERKDAEQPAPDQPADGRI